MSVRQRAYRTFEYIRNYPLTDLYPRYTLIDDKENLIRQYLELQTPKVRASKNSRGTGLNAKKKKSVLKFRSEHPDASISEIACQCQVDRKTISNYLRE